MMQRTMERYRRRFIMNAMRYWICCRCACLCHNFAIARRRCFDAAASGANALWLRLCSSLFCYGGTLSLLLWQIFARLPFCGAANFGVA
jgi:hypothetical protein